MRSPKIPRGTSAAFAIAVSVVFSGCATLSKEECLNAEWYTIGYEDGSRGIARTRLGDHRKACAEYGVQPRPGEYFRGHDEGLIRFCTPANGYRTGVAGRELAVSCPADLTAPFNEAYRYGRRVHEAEQARARHSRAVEAKRAELAKIAAARSEVEQQLVGSPGMKGQQRLRLKETRALFKREAALEMELAALERDNGARGGPANRGRENGNSGEHGRRGAAVGRGRDEAASATGSRGRSQGVGGNNGNDGKGRAVGRDRQGAGGKGRDGSVQDRNERKEGGRRDNGAPGVSRAGGRGAGHGVPAAREGKRVAVRTAPADTSPSLRGEKGPGGEKADKAVLRRKRKELEQVRREIRALEQQEMRANVASRRERAHLLKESKRLAREEQRLESELLGLERESERLQRDLDRLRAHSRWR